MVKFAIKSHHARYYNHCFCVPLSFDNANIHKIILPHKHTFCTYGTNVPLYGLSG